MSKKFTIAIISVLVILGAGAFLLHWQAKQIIVNLIKANTAGRVIVQIGGLEIIPIKNTIRVEDVAVRINDEHSNQHSAVIVHHAFLDVASLFDFFNGETLVIEKLQLDGGEITLPARTATPKDTAKQGTFNLAALIVKIKTTAIRFKIEELRFRNLNLTLLNKEARRTTKIEHFHFLARNLHLNADSVLKTKPLIEFGLPHQTIVLPSGIDLKFDTLFFSSSDNAIQGEQIKLNSTNPTADNQFVIESEKIRLAHFDFESLYTKGIAVIDSVFLDQSMLDIQRKQGNNTASASGLDSVPAFNIKHLLISDLATSLKLSKGAIENRYSIKNSALTIEDFWHKPDSAHKLSTRNFDLLVTQYNTFLGQQSTSISFDTVRIQKHSLSLLNFKITSPHQKLSVFQTEVFNLNQMDWYALLFNKKLVAEEVVVQNPIIHSALKPAHDPGAVPKDEILLENLKGFLAVKLFKLENATATLKLQEQHGNLLVSGAYAQIHFQDLIQSTAIDEVLNSVDLLSFHLLSLKTPELMGRLDKLKLQLGSLSIKSASLQANEKLALSFNDLNVQKIGWNQTNNSPTLNGVSWTTLDASIQSPPREGTPSDPKKLPSLSINNLSGGRTKFGFSSSALNFSAQLPSVKLTSIQLDSTVHLSGIDVKGQTAQFVSSANNASIGSFHFTDQGGELNAIRFNRQATDTLQVLIDKILVEGNLPALAQQNVSIKQLEMQNIKTSFSKHDSVQQMQLQLENNLILNQIRYHNKKLTVGSLTLEAGPFDIHQNKVATLKEEKANDGVRPAQQRLRTGVDTLLHRLDTTKTFRLRAASKKNRTATGNTITSLNLKSGRNGIVLSMSNISAAFDSIMQLDAHLDAAQLHDIHFSSDKLASQIKSGVINKVAVHSTHLKNPREIFRDNYSTVAIKNFTASIEAGDNLIQFKRMAYDPRLARASLNDLVIRPLKDRQAFLDEHIYQVNFIDTKIDSISINKWDVHKLLNDSVIQVSSVHVHAPHVDVHKDKTRPFFPGKVKPLPTNALQQLGLKVRLDTLLFDNGDIRYTEKSRITGQEGSIYFTQLKGRVRNIKNTDLKKTDSLYIIASTRFLDSARVNLRVKESYADTLGGFLMTTQASPFHTSILNPALIPMVAVDFESGFIDTLQMLAVGREYLSLGSMKMLYHDLKVNFLDKNDTSKHSIKNVILKFAANNFVIKTNNTKRIGKVFFERDRYRAVFQYWIRMILSGVTTSVGAKSNKKQIKKYLKELDQKKLPPIDQELSDL